MDRKLCGVVGRKGRLTMTVFIRPWRQDRTGKRWEYDVKLRWPDGTRTRERKLSPCTSKSATERWAERREQLLIKLREMPPEEVKETVEVPTLAVFEERYLRDHCRAERHKESTVTFKKSIYKNHLVPLLGARRLDDIDNSAVQELKARLAKHGVKMVNNVLTTLNSTLSKAVEWGVVSRMPCAIRLLKVPHKERDFYDFDRYDGLVAAAGKLDRRILVVVLLGGDAGLRLGEILALSWHHVRFDRSVLHITEAIWRGHLGTTKGGRFREVPMTGRLEQALRAHRHLVGERVLYRDDGEPVTSRVFQRWVERAERAAGMKETGRLHVLRHTFCSHLAMRGAPARTIQELAGHRDLSTTMQYMHLSPSAGREAIKLLDRGREKSGEGWETAAAARKSP